MSAPILCSRTAVDDVVFESDRPRTRIQYENRTIEGNSSWFEGPARDYGDVSGLDDIISYGDMEDEKAEKCLGFRFTPAVFWVVLLGCLALIGAGITLMTTGKHLMRENTTVSGDNIFENQIEDPSLINEIEFGSDDIVVVEDDDGGNGNDDTGAEDDDVDDHIDDDGVHTEDDDDTANVDDQVNDDFRTDSPVGDDNVEIDDDDDDDATDDVPSDDDTSEATNRPTLTREEALLEILSEVSTDEALSDRTSDQFEAYQWILNDDPAALEFSSATRREAMERYIAALFFFSLNKGSGWYKDHSFLTETHICNWNDGGAGFAFEGINCEDNMVVEIIMDMNRLKGTIPTEIALYELRVLGLGSNSISGTIPSELGNTVSLEELRLGGNDFTGTLPDDLSNLVGLETLLLQKNAFLEGTVPSSYSLLSNLEYVYIEGTQLNGNLDSSFCALNNEYSNFFANCGSGGQVTCTCCTFCCDDEGRACAQQF